MQAKWLMAPVALLALLMAGALGAPFHRDEVSFDTVQRDHFDAIAVVPDKEAPSPGPLHLRVDIVGDAADADTTTAFAWLAAHANVLVEKSADGAPLFLTRQDLSATSGRATLGATLANGIAAEVGDTRVGPCVVAHEILHLLGLGHVDDPSNIMYPHCTPHMLDSAKLEAWQISRLQSIADIHATTPRGVEVWVTRS